MNGATPALYAYLSYRDAPAAIEWLRALGFGVVTRQDGVKWSFVSYEPGHKWSYWRHN